MNDPIIQLVGVKKAHGKTNSPSVALGGADLEIARGEFVVIVGPSGSGKSTLLNIIGLLDRPDAGTYNVDGVATHGLKEAERDRLRAETFGFVFQSSNVILEESAARNAALGIRIQGLRRSRREEIVAAVLNQFGLAHTAERTAKNLSGGERQRLALARAVATSPKVLLADEPTGNLDSANSSLVIEYLQKLHQSGTTIVVITHDPDVAAAANRQILITDGELAVSPTEFESTRRQRPERSGKPAGRPRQALMVWRGVLDDISDALSSLSSKPLRSLMLIMAFVLGTGGLVEVIVTTTPSMDADAAKSAILSLDGVRGVGYRQSLPAAEAPVSLLPPSSFQNQSGFEGTVVVADEALLRLSEAKLTPAHMSYALDSSDGRTNAIVGRKAAQALGISVPGPGKRVWVNGTPFNVIAILTEANRDSTLVNSVIISKHSELSGGTGSLVVRTQPGYPAPLAEAIPKMLAPENPASIRVNTVADLRALRFGVANDMGTFIGVISWVLLALASLSAATSMYLSVQARSAEIALRRALGSSRHSIRQLFTIEGTLVGLAGGVAGSAVGIFAVLIICSLQGWSPVLALSSVRVGISAGGITGIVSSIYPAFAAARADPAQAIRG
ncbi:ATP-binding cassette domain-containing protein [Arthrobacter sp. FW305-123]|nr:ATP-binding cassette domain-containing protein [Arthrobacter sp. FW305-123]